ncbi:MAG: glycosyltransferase family 9 protein [Planctomycetota bacterium]|jgi:ADP-heptose:LPS heptosyltransferase
MEKILVVRLSSGGDILQALPALAILRRRRPKARIAFLVEDAHLQFVEGREEIDDLWVWPRRRWASLWTSARAPQALLECLVFWARLAKNRFDTVLDLQGNLKSGLHTAFSLAQTRVGYCRTSCVEGNALFTNRKVVPTDERGSRVRKYVDLLSGIGIHGVEPRPVPPPAGAEEAFARFAAASTLPQQAFWVLHPGTSPFGAYKQWPLDRWAALARLLAREAPVLISTGPGEEATASAFHGISGVTLPAGPLNWKTLAGALSRARAFAGCDSAPLHLAHALGTPSVGLFGPTSADLYRPWMSGFAVTPDLPCSPCSKRGCRGSPCMASISVDRVFEALRELEGREPLGGG